MTNNLNTVFGLGNSKLDKCILTFNISTSTHCPSDKRRMCSHPDKCYGKRFERFRPNVLSYHVRQRAFWNRIVFEPYTHAINTFMGKLVVELGSKIKDIRYFRFNVFGDFICQEDIDLMTGICYHFKRLGVKSYGYSSRHDLDFSSLRKHAVINGQNRKIVNAYMVHRETIPKGAKYACPGRCGPDTCMICAEKRGINIHTVLR